MMFPTPFANFFEQLREPRTTLELRMMALSQQIREKKGWVEKLNSEIQEKWRTEALAQGFTEDQVDFVFNELKYYISISQGPIAPAAVDGIWQADNLIETSLKEEFLAAVHKHLESEENKDYHPWTNNQVVDLVHPSLYCYVEGITQIAVPEEGVNPVKEAHGSKKMSPWLTPGKHVLLEDALRYRWLPAEVFLDSEGKATFTSDINNLDSLKCGDLYLLIAKIFEKFVPLFSRVLTDLSNFPPVKRVCQWDAGEEPGDEEEWEKWQDPNHRVISWEKVEFVAPNQAENVMDLKGKDLQVIVKLANIELTPENQRYPGGTWHVEGTENEAIVATGIFYYSSSNVTESRLFFREAVATPEDYAQNDIEGVRQVYGLEDEGPLNQVLGSVITMENRCLVFPNVYQHRVTSFELEDKSKGGYRKILVFFLVDPNKRVISTKHVLPQQKDWRHRAEDQQHGTMTLDEAKKHREDLMKSRKYAAHVDENGLYNRYELPCSLCEH